MTGIESRAGLTSSNAALAMAGVTPVFGLIPRENVVRGPIPKPLISAYRRVAAELVPGGLPTIERTAAAMGLSVRTLQRRLNEAGTSHSQIVDEVRCELAHELLRGSDLPVLAVSRRVGFADPSSFTRAFFRWTGMTPRRYRRTERSPSVEEAASSWLSPDGVTARAGGDA